MQLRLIDYVLWYASPILQTIMLLCMFRRGLHREFPFFFNYTLFSIVSDPILATLQHSYTAYYYAYLVNVSLGVILAFAVLQEIFQAAFRPYEALRDLGIILFRWSALVVLLFAVGSALYVGHKTEPGGSVFADVFYLIERSLRLAQCGLVFLLLLLSEYLGIPHRSLLFGISIGFGLFAAINTLVLTAFTHRTIVSKLVLREVNSAAYLLAVMVWFGYTLAAARARSSVADGVVLRPRDWNSALQDARTPIAENSLLDTMDRTVERLLYPSPAESEIKVSAHSH